MDLIVNQMVQFQVVHVSDGYRTVKIFTGTSISQSYFSVSGKRNALPKLSVSLVFVQELHNFRS